MWVMVAGSRTSAKRGLLQSTWAIHLAFLSMSERTTVPGKHWQKRDDAAQSRHPIRRALTVLKGGALSDFDNVAVRIADVAANLAVFWYRFRDEFGSSTFP
jgi:hypothetical protein